MNEEQAQERGPVASVPAKQGLARHKVLVACGVLVAVIALCEWAEWPFLRQPLQSVLRHVLKREITIDGGFGVRFFGPLRLRAGRVSIAGAPDAPGTSTGPGGAGSDFLNASQLRLKLPYSTLLALRKQSPADEGEAKPPLKISALEVDELQATLVRDKDGRANWQFGEASPDKGPLALPQFGRLVVGKGKIRIDDTLTGLDVNAEVHTVDGSEPSSSSQGVTRGLEVKADGSYRGRKIAAHLQASGIIPLAGSSAETGPVPIRLDARVGETELHFDGKAGDVLNLGSLDGRFQVKGPSLAAVGDSVGVTLPTTGAFAMHGDAKKDGVRWSVGVDDLSLGSSRLRGNFAYDPSGSKPKLSGDLGGARLSLPDLGPAFGTAPPRHGANVKVRRDSLNAAKPEQAKAQADAKASAPLPEGSGARVLPQREFDIPSLAAMDADVVVALDELDLGTSQLQQLSPLKAHIVLEQQTLTIKDIIARTAKGEVQGSLAINAQRRPPRWTADLRWSGVQLEEFVKARDRADRSGNHGYLSGVISGRAKVRGTGNSMAQVLATLDGEAQLWIRDGAISHLIVEIAGIDIAQALGMLVKGDDQLPMRCAVAGLKVQRGQIVPEVALIETSDSTLTVDGRISLADERMRLVFRAQPKDRSPISLRAPVHIGGTFTHPTVALDKASLGLRLAAGAALAAITPFAALLSLIDLGEPQKQVCLDAMDRMKNPPAAAPTPPAARPQRKR